MGRQERVLVLFNEPVLPESHPESTSEVEILENVDASAEALRQAGYEPIRLGIAHDPTPLLEAIRDSRPDVVLNLFEGCGDYPLSEVWVAGLLEWAGLPFTGSPPSTLATAHNKYLAKQLFLAHGLRTPACILADGALPEHKLTWPVIVKPAQSDCSIGVEQESVVTDQEALAQRVEVCTRRFGGPALVEEFIFGREFTVALVEIPEMIMLPITEAVFPEAAPGCWPILSYAAKWDHDSEEYQRTDYHFDATPSPDLLAQIERYARAAFRVLGARDYARIDFRVRDDELFLLELNPNPDFAPERALANNLVAGGYNHEDFVVQLVRNALARGVAGRPALQQRAG